MDVTHLALLRELAERGSVTEVAHATGRTPSAVSQQLKALQREAGVVLVERVGRGVRLTDAGHALVRGSIGIATALAEAEAAWQTYLGEIGGNVTVSFFHSAAELLLPGVLDRLAEHPAVTLENVDADVSQDDFARLTVDHDIVVAHRSDDRQLPDREGLRVVTLMREPLDVALPLDHPLAGRASLAPADLRGEDWIAPPEDFPIDRALVAVAAQAGSPVRVLRRTTHLPLIEKLVARGHGIALLPRHTTIEHAAGQFALVPLTDLRAGRQVEALMRPDRAVRRAVSVVLDALVAEAADHTTRLPPPARATNGEDAAG